MVAHHLCLQAFNLQKKLPPTAGLGQASVTLLHHTGMKYTVVSLSFTSGAGTTLYIVVTQILWRCHHLFNHSFNSHTQDDSSTNR